MTTGCQIMVNEIHCSVCDGEIGLHKRRGICPDLCDQWYRSCKYDMVTYSNKSVDFVLKDQNKDMKNETFHLVLLQNITTPEEFCTAMGYEVNHNIRGYTKPNVPYCYDGIPTANRLKLNQGKKGWNKPKNVAVWKLGFEESIKKILFAIFDVKTIAMIIFYSAFLLLVFYALYEFNQMLIRNENKLKKK